MRRSARSALIASGAHDPVACLGCGRSAFAYAFERFPMLHLARCKACGLTHRCELKIETRPGPKPQPLAARFARHVDLGGPVPTHRPDLGPCHIWTGAVRQSDGYGTLTVDGKTEQAHRVAFKIAEGRWPEPCALHHCDNRLCVRRSHLFEGSRPENTADMVAKGRGTSRSLSDQQVAEIVRRKATGETQTAIAAGLGVSASLVSLTLRKRA